jgi:hypothetical protein
MSNYTRDDDHEDMDDIEGMDDDDADDCDIDHGDAAADDDGDTDEEFLEFSEDEIGDVLTDALELYAHEHGMQDPRICTFRDAGFLTRNTGILVRMGGAEFELCIVRRR